LAFIENLTRSHSSTYMGLDIATATEITAKWWI